MNPSERIHSKHMILLASFLQARKCGQNFSFFISGEPISLSGFGVAFVNK
jgi:hypothetical protein